MDPPAVIRNRSNTACNLDFMIGPSFTFVARAKKTPRGIYSGLRSVSNSGKEPQGYGNFEIGRILHLRSEIRNLQSNWRSTRNTRTVQYEISEYGSEKKESTDFE